MRKSRCLFRLVLMAMVVCMLAGCSKVTQKNYDKIKDGMTVAEVEKILGEGTVEVSAAGAVAGLTGSAKVLTWGDDKKSITVTFADDKVVAKAQKGL